MSAAAACVIPDTVSGLEVTPPGARTVDDDTASSGTKVVAEDRIELRWSNDPVAARWRRLAGCDAPVIVVVDGESSTFRPGSEWATDTLAMRGGPLSIDPGGCPLEVDHLTAVPRPYSRRALWVPPAPHANMPAAISRTASAVWLSEPDTAVPLAADTIVAAEADGEIPVLVLYLRPERDCGGHSAGEDISEQQYLDLVAGVAGALDGHDAIVVVEPDATSLECGDARLVAKATERLAATQTARVYLDGGHPGWHTAAEQADRLRDFGVEHADGFALGVSNFAPAAALVGYGDEINAILGLPYVIDVSRSGAEVPAGEWCNPPGARVGPEPTLEAPYPLVDAQLWVKRPGESDGECAGGPPAGEWWPEGARRLLAR